MTLNGSVKGDPLRTVHTPCIPNDGASAPWMILGDY